MNAPHDYLDGDHSFKKWFSIMWKNGFFQLFVVGFTLLILQIINFGWVIGSIKETFQDDTLGGIMTVMGNLIPVTMCLLIGYKAFYQFWDDLKKGRSR